MPISPPLSSEGKKFEKSVLKLVADVLSLANTTEGEKQNGKTRQYTILSKRAWELVQLEIRREKERPHEGSV